MATAAPSSEPAWQCYYSSGWRVFAAGVVPDVGLPGGSPDASPADGTPRPSASTGRPFLQATRMWLAIDPSSDAVGPLDPAIPAILVVLETLPALGYCAPTSGSDRPPAEVVVAAWSVEAGGVARPLALRRVATPDGADTSTEGLFAPVGPGAGPTEGWPPGRYVFQVRGASEPYQRWFAVEVRGWSSGAPDASPAPADPSPTL